MVMHKAVSQKQLSRRSFARGSLGILALAALGSPLLAACSPGAQGGAAGTQGKGALPDFIRYEGVTPDLKGTDLGIPDVFYRYPAQPVKALAQAPGDGKAITSMVQTSSPIPPGVDKNAYWQELNRRLGSDLQISMTPATDYPSKFATVVAGDTLPDIFQVARGANSVPQLLQAKAANLTEHLSGNAIKDYPFLANIPSESWSAAMFGGEIFAIPIPRGVLQSTIQYRREDLLAAKGITAQPASFQDYLSLCKELSDPKANTWALTQVPINFIAQTLNVPNGWREENGQLTNKDETPEMKEALEAGRRMFAEGVVNPDAFAANAGQYKQWFLAGTAYFTGDSYSAWPAYYQQAAGQEGFKISALDVPGFDGGKGSLWIGSPTHSVVAFNKNAGDRLETFLQVANWLAAPFGTEEYLFRKYGVKGVHYQLSGTDPVPLDSGVGQTQLGQQYLADAPTVLYLPGEEDVVKAQYEQMNRVLPDGSASPVEGLYSETEVRKGSQLEKKLRSVRDDILQDRQPVAAWDDAVKEWRSGGGDKIRSELEEALAASKA